MDNIEVSRNLPITIDYYKGYGFPPQTKSLHYHIYNELSVVKSGKIYYNSDDINKQLDGNCVIFSREHCLHNNIVDPKYMYERYQVKFYSNFFLGTTPDISFLSPTIKSSFVKELKKKEFDELYSVIESLYNIIKSNEHNSFDAMHETVQLLSLIMKAYKASSVDGTSENNYIINVIEYIKSNYYKQLTIESIAEQFFISRGKLMYDFKRYCNMNILEYVTMIKIEMAKDFLLKGLSVASVAENCGFSSTSYFIKVFSKIMGTTPLKFQLTWSQLPNKDKQ